MRWRVPTTRNPAHSWSRRLAWFSGKDRALDGPNASSLGGFDQGLEQHQTDAPSPRLLSDVHGMLGDAGVSASVGHRGLRPPSRVLVCAPQRRGADPVGGWRRSDPSRVVRIRRWGGHSTFSPSRTPCRNMLCKRGQHGMRVASYGIIRCSNFLGHPADGRNSSPKLQFRTRSKTGAWRLVSLQSA